MTLKIVTPVATVFIAAFVAVIGYNQWRINREKLRLDLFNRRFDIYLCALDYYVGLFKGNQFPGETQTMALVKAVRESRFIFPKHTGVHEFLEEFRARASAFSSYPQKRETLKDMPKERAELAQKESQDTQWLHDSIPALEKKMERFIRFDSL